MIVLGQYLFILIFCTKNERASMIETTLVSKPNIKKCVIAGKIGQSEKISLFHGFTNLTPIRPEFILPTEGTQYFLRM